MKSFIQLMLCLILAIPTNAQKQTVYSIVKQKQSIDWYQNQYKLWNLEIEKNDKNPIAWQNAYIALRLIKISSSFKTQNDLDEFVTKMQKSIPNTYEYHYLTYYNREPSSDKYIKLFHHIESAYKLDSTRNEILPDLVTYHLMKGNKNDYEKFCKKWYCSNSISGHLLNFGYNILASCEDESVLITNGDNDTYPLFLVQEAMKYKKKVKVLNIYLLQKEEYRNRVFAELGIPKLVEKKEDFKDDYEFMKAIAAHLENKLSIPLYYSSTTNPGLYKSSADKVYVVGLALKYSEQKFDNIALLKKNVEQNFKLDYLSTRFYIDISEEVILNSNNAYLTAFLTLYKHYKESGDSKEANKLKLILTAIAEKNTNKKYILNFIEEC